jgi:plasmid maintenance system antidote protein VapI
MNWLEQIAPTIATCFGGPLAGLAVSAIAKAVGVDEKDVNNLIQDNKLDAAQIASLKLAEIHFKESTQQLGLNFETLAVADRKSARDMQATTRSYIPGVLAVGVTIGFFGILYSLMAGLAVKSDELMIMLGSLGTAWTGIVGFYFGSSAGSQAKDILLHQSTPTNTGV